MLKTDVLGWQDQEGDALGLAREVLESRFSENRNQIAVNGPAALFSEIFDPTNAYLFQIKVYSSKNGPFCA